MYENGIVGSTGINVVKVLELSDAITEIKSAFSGKLFLNILLKKFRGTPADKK